MSETPTVSESPNHPDSAVAVMNPAEAKLRARLTYLFRHSLRDERVHPLMHLMIRYRIDQLHEQQKKHDEGTA